ncbi:hypothetical protein FDECE_8844 [Fusarium decemcellulare]|nr:hypothetical protein FDECE_8844 [Fusarium decemcellulare]
MASSQDDAEDALLSDPGPIGTRVSDAAIAEYETYKAIFTHKPDGDGARFTLCLSIRERMLGDAAKYRGCFRRFYDLMYNQSVEFRTIMADPVVDNPVETKKWQALYLTAIGQPHPSATTPVRNTIRPAPELNECNVGASNAHDAPPHKRRRLNVPAVTDDRPTPDPVSDKEWVNKVLRETSHWIRDKAPKEETNRKVEGNQIVAYLEAGCPPNLDPKNGLIEAYYCSTTEARHLVDTRNETVPIITHNQQPFDWRDEHGPIHSLFTQWIKNAMRNKKVVVQIPTLPTTDGTQTKRTLEQVYRKFVLKDGLEGELWKLLDLENPVPTPTPPFLTSAKCQLLRRLRDEMNKGLPPEMGSFILLSEGGNHTISHVDSHGFGTFITAQEGRHGFGWVSHPSEQDRRMWREDPYSVKHLARYVVLRPGQTVFFPGNTIHFVFRALDEPTLATGGHILKWSTIMGWLRIMKFQQCDNSGANDDVTAASIRQWTSPLKKIIDSCIDSGDVDDIGGLEEAQRISDAVKDWKNFDASH